jgi:hypothetical protein
MTHTPGPWRKGLCGDIVTEDGRIIAQIFWPRSAAHANARLVAAAPDLLEALEKTLFPLKTAALRGSHGAENAFIRAEKAIAKARGGT